MPKGRSVNAPEKKQVHVIMRKDLVDALQIKSMEKDVSVSALIRKYTRAGFIAEFGSVEYVINKKGKTGD